MTIKDSGNMHFESIAIRGGYRRTQENEHSEALFLTSSYIFENCDTAAKYFNNELQGNVYSRYSNPTVRTFEERLAALEGADRAVATSSGMAATLSVVMGLLSAGDHIICSREVFGSTITLMDNTISKFGVEVSYVALTDINDWKKAIKPHTKMLFCESPSNPLNEVADLEALAALARQANCLLVVDNCFCTPALQRPLEWGADIVVHSATKYIDGQGRCLGGAVVGSDELMAPVIGFLRSAGPTMSAFNAWIFLKGLETLSLRMRAHSSSALQLALWLERKDQVVKVNYSGLKQHSGHALACKQQDDFGGVLSFQVKGCRDAAWRFIDATQMLSLTANLGDSKTTIVHPASTTHSRLSNDQRNAAGITENLIRVAVGLENIEDIQRDLEFGFGVI